MSAPRIALSANTAWYIANFRSGLIRALKAEGYDVVVIAPLDDHAAGIEAMGCRFVALPMDNKGANPAKDARLLLQYLAILRRERAAAFIGHTIKPNVYGSLAANALGIPVINNISGLGTVFIKNSWLTQVVKNLYRVSLRQSQMVYFENRDDRALFVGEKLVKQAQTQLLPGSGIDLEKFKPDAARSRDSETVNFLLVARLLYDKGIGEYVEAARILREHCPRARCALLGFLDAENRTAIARADLDAWIADGLIDYLGSTADVRPFIASSDCVVLPSYREGTPRTLLEASAMGKPIIATDVPGCREVVDHGVTGLLCTVRDAESLAGRMVDVAEMGLGRRDAMGAAGRAKICRQFDERIVIDSFLAVLRKIPAAAPEKLRRAA